jgi:hypothetical protein
MTACSTFTINSSPPCRLLEDGMDTFTFGMQRNRLLQALGSNPLVRRSDRIEALSFVAAVLILVIATPFVGAFATSVHDTREQVYTREAQHRHPATATATEEGELVAASNDVWFTAHAQWNAAGEDRVGVVKWPGHAKIGDSQAIWVDDDGQYAPPPGPPSRATTDAWAIGLLLWIALFGALAGAYCAIRWRLDARRFAQWELRLDDQYRLFNQGRE